MHRSVMEWVAGLMGQYELEKGSTLEVGSLNENGSVKALFKESADYIGVDMREGRGVDQLALAHDLPFVDGAFDTVVSTEMLEHDEQFWLSLPEMGRVLKQGGLMILTARGNGFPPHAYPNDYWRFMADSGPVLLRLAKCSVLESFPDPSPGDPGIFCLGRKNPTKPLECTCEAMDVLYGAKHKAECPYGQWLLVEQANAELQSRPPQDLT